MVVINKQLTKAYSTAIYIQWIPIQQEKLRYIFREYCVDIVTGKLEPHVACNYTTTISNTSINITGLQPSTDYHIAVSYSATDDVDKHVIWSDPSDILNVKTRSLCKLEA